MGAGRLHLPGPRFCAVSHLETKPPATRRGGPQEFAAATEKGAARGVCEQKSGCPLIASGPPSDGPELNITCPVLLCSIMALTGQRPAKKNLQELFHETLKDIYFAEKKIHPERLFPRWRRPHSSQEC